ncbi:MAG: hypothetical protein IPK37_08590 [Austwickia sp.]|jgi:hypothetical protein|nr:MAG: hypothetical protein IPK37_08590 [Austwickia sp.]
MSRMSATISRPTIERGRRTAAAARAAASCEIPAAVPATSGQVTAACPTCQAAGDSAIDVLPGASHPGVRPAQCPTCGVTSIEFGLVLAIDDVLVEMTGLDRLDKAL